MKSLTIICMLLMVFSASLVQAQQYEVAPCGSKAFTTTTYVAPGGQICFDIWLTGVATPQQAGGVWIDFIDSIADIAEVSSGRCLSDGSEGCTGPWDPSPIIEPPLLPPGGILIVVANLGGAFPDGDGDLIVGTVTLQNLGPGAADATVNITTIPAVSTWTPADDATINANTTQPVLTIHEVCPATTDADCDDGLFCNGVETWDGNCGCNPGIPPCDDGNRCTLDCDEDTDFCLYDVCDISALSCWYDPCFENYQPCWEIGCFSQCDADCDFREDEYDNCPNTPNHLIWGTCTQGNIGQPCENNGECDMEFVSGFCSLNQEDSDHDGYGDACDFFCVGNGVFDSDEDGICDDDDNCPNDYNPEQNDTDNDCMGDICDADLNNPDIPNPLVDIDFDGIGNACDNCPGNYNPLQEDTYPPTQGNSIGDACDCEADFNCDGNVDGVDVEYFLWDFGRSQHYSPCTNEWWCYGDFTCNGNVDADDVTKFLEDFGRNQYFNPCPACVAGGWCVYP